MNSTALILIDNNCKNININSVRKIINNKNFKHVSTIDINGEKIKKELLENYLPNATNANHLKLNDLKWCNVLEYADVILINESYQNK